MKIVVIILMFIIYYLPSKPINVQFFCILTLIGLWIGLVIYNIIKLNKKKPAINKNSMDIKTVPYERSTIELGYLVHGKITSSIMGPLVIELVRKKALTIGYSKKNRDYILASTNNKSKDLTVAEEFLYNWMIKKIGNGSQVSLSTIKKDAITNSGYFLACYHEWNSLAAFEGTKTNLFESTKDYVDEAVKYICLSILLVLLAFLTHMPLYLITISLVTTFIYTLYMNFYNIRTKMGGYEYCSWLSLISNINKRNVDYKALSLDSVLVQIKLFNRKTYSIASNIASDFPSYDSDILKYSKSGIVDEICSKFNKFVPTALFFSLFSMKNKGSRANMKYKRNEEI